MRNAKLPFRALLLVGIIAPLTIGRAEVIFSDGFETGDRSKSENGFLWSRSGGNVYVSSDVAHTGRHSLAFSYNGKPSGEDSTAEQRFTIGSPQTELWLRFWMLVPTNYYHRDDSPSNNKFITLWSKDYQDRGGFLFIGLWSDTIWDKNQQRRTTLTGNSNATWNANGPPLSDSDSTVFIDRAHDLGKWIEVTLHWRRASGVGVADGIVEMWKGDETQRQIIFSRRDVANWGPDDGLDPAFNFLDRGYLFGWSNSGFAEDTYFYVDDVIFSNTPLESMPTPATPKKVVVK